VRLLLHHPHVELTAVTSRQYAGQAIAQVFRSSHIIRAPNPSGSLSPTQNCWRSRPKSFPRAAARRGRRVCRSLLQLGCQVIDLSADFRVKTAAVYKEFYAHDIRRRIAGHSRLRPARDYRAHLINASLVACPAVIHEHSAAHDTSLARRLHKTDGIIANSLSGVSARAGR